MRYEAKNKIDWKKNKCVICKFLMKLDPTNYLTADCQMTFGDFIIRYEHKFLRNIYTAEQISQSDHIANLKNYYEVFKEYIQTCIGLLASLNSYDRHNFINDATEEFVEERFPDKTLREIKSTINKTEIKNALIQSCGSVFKFNLKVYAYVYDELLILPTNDIQYDTITTNNFFIHVHRLIKGKVHLHHSHITGEIIGYSHDFCNTTVIEKSNAEIPFIAHNFFGFDLFYFMQTYIASAWCLKEVNIGEINLTHANYGNISNEIKLTNSLKFYKRSLSELSSTLTDDEKKAVKSLTENFLNHHYYFSTLWPYLTPSIKNNILNIIAEGKGIKPYEIIIDMDSFFLKPDKGFWEKTEFFSELKLSAIDNESYENLKYLYHNLKMRNLGNLNDFYNTQDVIFLCETIESRFQPMQNSYGFNPRKCNSASTMSGCIEREMSKVIIALPTKYEHTKFLEQTVIGGFSCVNTRLTFDTQILLPN